LWFFVYSERVKPKLAQEETQTCGLQNGVLKELTIIYEFSSYLKQ
jgi:hypothetical protein